MDEADYTDLDRRIAALGEDFSRGLMALASSPAVQRGLLAAALADLIWTLYIDFPSHRDVLHEELTTLAAAVELSSEEHRAMAGEEMPATER